MRYLTLNSTDYYPFGMPQIINGEPYRYSYQGEFAETDPETGKPAFQLRLWDARIGRWLTTDPYGQYNSPYMGMGNNPMNGIDPDGGSGEKADGIFTLNKDTGKLTKVSNIGDDVGEHLILTINNKREVLNQKQIQTSPGDLTVDGALRNNEFYKHFVSQINYDNTSAGINLLRSRKKANTSNFLRLFYNDFADKTQKIGTVSSGVGYALTFTVVGAPVGAELMSFGAATSTLGAAMKLPQQISNSDYKGIALTITSEIIGAGIGHFFKRLHKADVIDNLSRQIFTENLTMKANFIINQFND